MDISPILNDALQIVALLVVPLAAILGSWGMQILSARLGIRLDEKDAAAVQNAVSVGAGMIRAKLAAGTVAPIDLHTGNAHVDDAAEAAMAIVDASVEASGVTRQSIADQIVASVGHALGNDPTVPSVPVPVPATSK